MSTDGTLSGGGSSLVPGIHLLTPLTPNLPKIIDGVVHVHASCILHDGTLATFLPPLSHSQLYEWWEQRLQDVSRDKRRIIVSLSDVKQRTQASGQDGSVREVKAPWAGEGREWPVIATTDSYATDATESPEPVELEVSGVVILATPFAQTGPFRGVVEKLFVSPLHRRRGIAKLMMAKLETVALELERWSLMLDTTVGTEAEKVYPRLGYQRLGVVTDYGISPVDGRLVDEVWFWKDLRKMKRLDQGEYHCGPQEVACLES